MLLSRATLFRRAIRCAPFTNITNGSRYLSVGHYKPNLDDERKKKDQMQKEKEGEEDSPKEPSRLEQMKELFYEYRYPFIAYYGITYITPIVPFYISLQYFGVDGVEILEWVDKWVGFGQDKIDMLNPTYVNIAIAGEMNELLEFIRLPVVLTTTPRVAKWWRSRR